MVNLPSIRQLLAKTSRRYATWPSTVSLHRASRYVKPYAGGSRSHFWEQ